LQDSLWAAEDIEAVFDQDPQRVCILQGPVAVKYSTVKDEPIKDLLGNINASLVEKLLHLQYGGDKSKIATIDYLSVKPAPTVPSIVDYVESDGIVSYKLNRSLPVVHRQLEKANAPYGGYRIRSKAKAHHVFSAKGVRTDLETRRLRVAKAGWIGLRDNDEREGREYSLEELVGEAQSLASASSHGMGCG
jgi:enoyl reductase-like protein